ncbi:MAG: hypothetical protein AAF417_12930 [Pseudomonadota bacterium]
MVPGGDGGTNRQTIEFFETRLPDSARFSLLVNDEEVPLALRS